MQARSKLISQFQSWNLGWVQIYHKNVFPGLLYILTFHRFRPSIQSHLTLKPANCVALGPCQLFGVKQSKLLEAMDTWRTLKCTRCQDDVEMSLWEINKNGARRHLLFQFFCSDLFRGWFSLRGAHPCRYLRLRFSSSWTLGNRESGMRLPVHVAMAGIYLSVSVSSVLWAGCANVYCEQLRSHAQVTIAVQHWCWLPARRFRALERTTFWTGVLLGKPQARTSLTLPVDYGGASITISMLLTHDHTPAQHRGYI